MIFMVPISVSDKPEEGDMTGRLPREMPDWTIRSVQEGHERSFVQSMVVNDRLAGGKELEGGAS